ncbi:MAG TPA: ABC transporter ATP-binding protein [Candidatus Izemoplasmatales bacterium]|nr:ABC transporter ATP-binding protein [Candidatus Izemoplasmatales bacterium]
MIRKLAKNIGKYKFDTFMSPLMISLEVVMEVIIPLLMAKLIDDGITPGDLSAVVKFGLLLVLSASISLGFGSLSCVFSANASAGFAANIRKKTFDNVQDFSFRNIDKFQTSSIITRLTTDVSNVQNAFQMLIRIAFRAPIMLVAALIITISISPTLSLTFLLVIPILIIGFIFIIKSVFPVFTEVFKKYDGMNNIVQEDIAGIRVVKTYVREDYEKEKFRASSQEIYKYFSKGEKILAAMSPLMQFSMYVCILVISYFGAVLIVKGIGGNMITTGELTSLITYSGMILSSLMMVSMVIVMITISRASAIRITELLDEKSDITNPNNPVTNVNNGDIIFDHVDFRYSENSERKVLDDINFKIKSGQTIGIIGSTGSSKSSLVQLIARLYDSTAGSIYVGGNNVKDYDIEALRNSVAVVLQKNVLFSGSIKDNLRWGNENATEEEMIRACRMARADEFIREMPKGYDTHIEQGGTNVSGGQKQRLCIARALLKNPKILILDDSTSAVDTRTDAEIRKMFKNELQGVTKIVITQRISSIEDADAIIVMEGGQLNQMGTHEDLLATNAIYREVYESQSKAVMENA